MQHGRASATKRQRDPQIWHDLRASWTDEKREDERQKRKARDARRLQRAVEQVLQGAAATAQTGSQGVSTEQPMPPPAVSTTAAVSAHAQQTTTDLEQLQLDYPFAWDPCWELAGVDEDCSTQVAVYAAVDLKKLPQGADLTSDLSSILCSGRPVVVLEDTEVMLVVASNWISADVADATAAMALQLYLQLPGEAIQDRSSALPGVTNGIKMVGNRVPMGNYSSNPTKGSAGIYDYMGNGCVVNGQPMTVATATGDIARALCAEMDMRGGVPCSMMRHGWRASRQRIGTYTGEGLLALTPVTAVGLSVAPDFANKHHLDTGDLKYAVIIWLHAGSASGYESGSKFTASAAHGDHLIGSGGGDSHSIEGGEFCMTLSRGITGCIKPQHGMMVGLQSSRIRHHTEPVSKPNGWHQIGVALVHKQAAVTGCLKVQVVGKRATIVAKTLGSSSYSRSAAAVQQFGESCAAAEACLGKSGNNTAQLTSLLSCVEGLHTRLCERVQQGQKQLSGQGVAQQPARRKVAAKQQTRRTRAASRGGK